jgi:tRNA (adenine57-N1/adenine58-N1)-methyltransferase
VDRPEVFKVGDRVQLTGPKGRMNTFTLSEDGKWGSHRGEIKHSQLIGQPEGSVILNSAGVEYLALKPLLSDFVLSMPRGANIIYPKDAGQIITQGDIFPGARVVEAGVGSGGLSSYLLRAIGTSGRLHSFEKRAEFSEIAQSNVITELGFTPKNWTVTVGPLEEKLLETVEPGSIDRVVLDMLSPWSCIDQVSVALRPGGVLIVYVATVTQLSRVTQKIEQSADYTKPLAQETMVRGWHVEGLAVRPEHRMISHTGFLLFARRLAPNTVLPEFKTKRASKTQYSDEDLEIWTPEALGESGASAKKVRKNVRKAEAAKQAKLTRGGIDIENN